MKIKFIKEYVAVAPDTNLGIVHRYRVGETKEIKGYTAQWLIDNGFAEEVLESGWWKPEHGEEYWGINSDGCAFRDRWLKYSQDRIRMAMGNCFKTKAAAERYRDYLEALATVRQDKGVLTPEQAAENRYNYYICIHNEFGLVVHGFNADYVSVNTVLFDTREHAQASRDNHPDEWKIIANYDWSRE